MYFKQIKKTEWKNNWIELRIDEEIWNSPIKIFITVNYWFKKLCNECTDEVSLPF